MRCATLPSFSSARFPRRGLPSNFPKNSQKQELLAVAARLSRANPALLCHATWQQTGIHNLPLAALKNERMVRT
jgi:hypothetical protein